MSSRSRWMRRTRPLFTAYLPVMPVVFFALFPLYFMLVTSLKKNAELGDVNSAPFLIGGVVPSRHYAVLPCDTPLWICIVYSLTARVAATVIPAVNGLVAVDAA